MCLLVQFRGHKSPQINLVFQMFTGGSEEEEHVVISHHVSGMCHESANLLVIFAFRHREGVCTIDSVIPRYHKHMHKCL